MLYLFMSGVMLGFAGTLSAMLIHRHLQDKTFDAIEAMLPDNGCTIVAFDGSTYWTKEGKLYRSLNSTDEINLNTVELVDPSTASVGELPDLLMIIEYLNGVRE